MKTVNGSVSLVRKKMVYSGVPSVAFVVMKNEKVLDVWVSDAKCKRRDISHRRMKKHLQTNIAKGLYNS